MKKEKKVNRKRTYLLEFDMCALCMKEVRDLYESAKNEEKVRIRLITNPEDYLTHLEIIR